MDKKKRYVVFGHRQHGKDTACELLESLFGLTYQSSSYFACRLFLFDQLRDSFGYTSIDQCYEDRDQHRELWYQSILAYNTPDLARLGSQLFDRYDVYCGIRDRNEFLALKERYDLLTIFIDANDRKPLEDSSSMKLSRYDADVIIDNNTTLDALSARLRCLFKRLGHTPLDEQYRA